MSDSALRAYILFGAIFSGLVSCNLWTHPAVSNWFDEHDSPGLRVVRVLLRFYRLEGAPDGWNRLSLGIITAVISGVLFAWLLITQLSAR